MSSCNSSLREWINSLQDYSKWAQYRSGHDIHNECVISGLRERLDGAVQMLDSIEKELQRAKREMEAEGQP